MPNGDNHPIPPSLIEAMLAKMRKEKNVTHTILLPPPALTRPGDPKGYKLYLDGRVEPTNDVDPKYMEAHRTAPKAAPPGSERLPNGMLCYERDAPVVVGMRDERKPQKDGEVKKGGKEGEK